MYGGDSYGGTEYAGARATSTGSIITIVGKAINSVYLTTKKTALALLSKLRSSTVTTSTKKVSLSTNQKSVTLKSKNDNIIL